MSLQCKNDMQIFLLVSVVEKTIITNFLKTGRKNMLHETADEFGG